MSGGSYRIDPETRKPVLVEPPARPTTRAERRSAEHATEQAAEQEKADAAKADAAKSAAKSKGRGRTPKPAPALTDQTTEPSAAAGADTVSASTGTEE